VEGEDDGRYWVELPPSGLDRRMQPIGGSVRPPFRLMPCDAARRSSCLPRPCGGMARGHLRRPGTVLPAAAIMRSRDRLAELSPTHRRRASSVAFPYMSHNLQGLSGVTITSVLAMASPGMHCSGTYSVLWMGPS
jgi:hypothetical protein